MWGAFLSLKCPDFSVLPPAVRGDRVETKDREEREKIVLFAVAFILLHSLSQMNAVTFTATLLVRQKYAASNMPC